MKTKEEIKEEIIEMAEKAFENSKKTAKK